MSSNSVQKLFKEAYPSFGEDFQDEIKKVCVNEVDFYPGKTLTIISKNHSEFRFKENVWIVRLRDPKIFNDFMLVSNRCSTSWISIDKITN